jgi:GMP synthase-like glutamine amidotransferase
MFRDLLAQPGDTWDVMDVQHAQFPDDVAAYDGYVITGSRASAYDREPWVLRLLELIREIHGRRIPLLGMCFGHQAVALALGGEVAANLRGWDVGVRTLELTPLGRALPLLAQAPRLLAIHKLHSDAVTRLPPGAIHLVRSPHTEYEGFALGATTLCLQGHAEFDNRVIKEALEKLAGANLLAPAQAQAGRASLATPVPRAFWQERLRSFFAQGGLTLPAAAAAQALRR